jgi:hypothetical protein
MDLLPWVLIVQLWSPNSDKIKIIHTQVYPNYAECQKAAVPWREKKFIAICGVKQNYDKSK